MKTSAYYLAGIWMLAFLIGGCKGQTKALAVNTPAASATAAMTETATPAPTATSPADATATALQATAQALATVALSESAQLTEAVRAESGLDGIGVQFEFDGEAVWAVFFAAGPQGFNALTYDAAGALTPMERQAEPLTAEKLYEPWLWSAIREAGASPKDVTGLELVTWNMPQGADGTDLRQIQVASYQTAPTTPTAEMAMRVFDTAGREYVVHLPEALRREMQARLATASAGEPLPPLTLAQDVAFSPEAVELLQDVAEQGEAMAFGRDEEGNLLVRNLATGEILLIESERGSGEMILYQAWLEANPEAHLELLEKELAAASGFQRVELLAQIHTLENTEESALALAEAIIELAPSNETPIPIEIDGKMYDFAWIQFIYRGRQYKASYWIDWILDYFGEEEGQRMIEEGQKLLPPPVIAGGGRDGKYFYLNPETGERVEFSTVFVPGKGEVDFYEVMMMDPSELANLVIDAIADEQHKDYWEFARQHYMAYPVVVVSSFVVNLAPIYQEVIQMGTPGEDFSTMDMPTNLLGIPFFDANTGELLTLGTLSAGLGPELSTYYINNEGKIIRLVKNGFSTMDNFGDDPQTKVGIILLGDTTAASYGFRGASTGVLELSPEYGAEPELLAVSAAFRSGDLETGLRQLSQLRGFVGRSPHIVAPAAK